MMFCGWVGVDLEIDLSLGQIERKGRDPKLLEAYLGGKGTNAKILWERVPPEVDPLSPNSLLIVGTGALVGTMIPAANRTIITFRSPVTGLHALSAMGGAFGVELKHAGYDTIIISGKSPTPVYLWINNDKVELRDASHLWGKDTWETQRILQDELKEDKVQILCVGPAGEKIVYMATIEGSGGASASRAGAGAIMGGKNLKAIVVRGTKDINIANGSKLVELSEQILSRTGPLKEKSLGSLVGHVTPDLVNLNLQAMGHFSGDVTPDVQRKAKDDLGKMVRDFAKEFKSRDVACYNCGMGCKWMLPDPDSERFIITKCQAFSAFIIHSQIVDLDYALKFYSLCRKYGLDDISLPYCIAFAIDLYQKGILTTEDTDGMRLEWRNAEVVFSLVEKITRREGIGDVLASGAYRAAQQIGKGAEDYVYHVKKLELLPVDYSGRPIYALPQAISDKADRTRALSGTSLMVWRLLKKEDREAYLNSVFWGYPKDRDFEKYFLADYDPTGVDYEGLCQFAAYDEETLHLVDASGCCFFWQMLLGWPPISNRPLVADLISCATGMDIDETGATEIARRIANLVRAYNVRAGMKRKDDSIPKIFFEKSRIAPHHQFDRALFNQWIDRYYQIRGWNSDGIPTKETLDKLGLDYVRQDLERREILT